MPIMETDLLPCPFCGGKAEIQLDQGRNRLGTGCTQCFANQTPEWDNERNVITAWNTRSTPSGSSALADELELQPVRTQVHNLGTETQSYGARTVVLPITLRDRILTALRTPPREEVLREALEETRVGLSWIQSQADNAMGVTAGCATTHGDPGGGLEEANRYASDIAINAVMMADKIDAALNPTTENDHDRG